MPQVLKIAGSFHSVAPDSASQQRSDGGYFALGNSRRPLLKNSGQVSSHYDQPWLSRQLDPAYGIYFG